jgi:hypothetical protein
MLSTTGAIAHLAVNDFNSLGKGHHGLQCPGVFLLPTAGFCVALQGPIGEQFLIGEARSVTHLAADNCRVLDALGRIDIDILTILLQPAYILFTLQAKTLERKGRIQPGAIQAGDIHTGLQISSVDFYDFQRFPFAAKVDYNAPSIAVFARKIPPGNVNQFSRNTG